MTDWNTCQAVERRPGRVSGAWLFRGTRVPITALLENLREGATVDEFLEWFPGVTADQVRQVLSHQIDAIEQDEEDARTLASEHPQATGGPPAR